MSSNDGDGLGKGGKRFQECYFFQPKDYRNWFSRFCILLDSKGILGAVEPDRDSDWANLTTKEQETKRKQALQIIVMILGPEYQYLLDAGDLATTWARIKGYEKKDAPNMAAIRAEYQAFNWKPGMSIANYFGDMVQLRSQMLSFGITLQDDEVVNKLFSGLPLEFAFDHIAFLWHDRFDLEWVRSHLEVREKQMIADGHPPSEWKPRPSLFPLSSALESSGQMAKYGTASYHSTTTRDAWKPNLKGITKKFKCHYCGKPGHTKAECRGRAADDACLIYPPPP